MNDLHNMMVEFSGGRQRYKPDRVFREQHVAGQAVLSRQVSGIREPAPDGIVASVCVLGWKLNLEGGSARFDSCDSIISYI